METPVLTTLKVPIQSEYDIVKVRKLVREWSEQAHFSLIKQTKLITAASELARNIFKYAGTGTVQLTVVNLNRRIGLQLIFEDQGPGIADIEQAMTDGFSTGKSLGMGLSGTRRLVDEFNIRSAPGEGTRVNIILWE